MFDPDGARGKDQLLSGLRVKVRLVLGTENHRRLIAPSDQKGVFRS